MTTTESTDTVLARFFEKTDEANGKIKTFDGI